jgi:hypothetical protein
MTDREALVARLTALTEAEQIAFAAWAEGRRTPRIRSTASQAEYLDRWKAEEEAIAAFGEPRRDGTVPEPRPWAFMFDALSPETGWDAWRAAVDHVRAMAAALHAADEAAIDALSPAFEALALSPGMDSPSAVAQPVRRSDAVHSGREAK